MVMPPGGSGFRVPRIPKIPRVPPRRPPGGGLGLGPRVTRFPGQPRFPRIPRIRKPAAGARLPWLPRLKRPAGFVKPPKNKSKFAPLWLLLRGAAVLVLVLIVAVAGLGFWSSRRPIPQTDGRLSLPGLSAPVEVIRDEMGIPHIYAATTADLFLAQGLVHAQDRFWQMDVARHIGAGRLSEMFGPDQVETDSFLRTLGWEPIVVQEFAAADEEARLIFESYAAGVNAYLEMRSPSELAFEYSILELTNRSYDPEPWQPTDTLLWGKLLSWELRGNLDTEIDRSLLIGLVGADRAAELYPAYPFDNPPIVPGYGEGTLISALGVPSIVEAGLDLVAERAANLDALTGGGFDGIGSNSWVVGPQRSATGAAILANDPHLGVQIPSIWYQVGLHCTETSPQCPWQVTGFSIPGAPGVVIGHNDRIAWGFTNLGPDVMDLYVERINPDDPNQYEIDGRWVDMDVSVVPIEVAGSEPVDLTIRSTRHGPIISDAYEPLDDFDRLAGIDVPSNYAIALAWTALAPSRTFDSILELNRAQNWTDFRAAAEAFDVPSQNLVYADVDGNIGYQAPGRIPIRAEGDGQLPVPGWTDRYEWVDYVPFDELPALFNPPSGVIVTANNAVVGPDFPFLLGTGWDAGYRAARIGQLLTREEPFTLDDMAAIQLDTHNPAADVLLPVLLEIDFDSPDAIAAQATLASWDRNDAVDSAGAAIFEAFWSRLLVRTFDDELPDTLAPAGTSRWIDVMARLSDRPTNKWWDDVGTGAVEGRDAIFRAAFVAAVADLTERLGDDRAKWSWGRLHTVTFEHQTLGTSGVWPIEGFFNRGPYPVAGTKNSVNAIGWTASEGFEVDWLPSMRMIVDLGNLDASRTVYTTGQSGHPYGPHYLDMVDLWLAGEYYPMRWDRAGIEENAAATLTLVP